MRTEQPTVSNVISMCRKLLADKPQDFQLKVLWLLLEAIAADIDQVKTYMDAMHSSLTSYANTVQAYSAANAARANKLAYEAEKLFGSDFNEVHFTGRA